MFYYPQSRGYILIYIRWVFSVRCKNSSPTYFLSGFFFLPFLELYWHLSISFRWSGPAWVMRLYSLNDPYNLRNESFIHGLLFFPFFFSKKKIIIRHFSIEWSFYWLKSQQLIAKTLKQILKWMLCKHWCQPLLFLYLLWYCVCLSIISLY